jgi:hypothetical protein
MVMDESFELNFYMPERYLTDWKTREIEDVVYDWDSISWEDE